MPTYEIIYTDDKGRTQIIWLPALLVSVTVKKTEVNKS